MEKINNHKPTQYPPTDTLESYAITTFDYIINQKNIKTDLNKRDKVPNIDGYLEIVEDDQTPFGKVEVQIKKLSDINSAKPKYQCKIGFLKYCEISILPVLLILVDTKNEVAYWKLCNDLLKELSIKEGSKTKIIHIPTEKIIKKGESDYIDEWKEIIANYKTRLFSYESKNEEIKKLRESYEILLENSDPLFGLENEEFKSFHIFLDKLNYLMDTYFSVIIDIYYKGCWKLGFAYGNYTKKSITYMLYPISINKNDTQIKKISKNLENQLLKKGLSVSIHSLYLENPFDSRPNEHAIEAIKEKIKEILDDKLLSIDNVFLIREFLFSFVDTYSEVLGLEKKDSYSTEEIFNSVYLYFYIWLEEAINRNHINLENNYYVNLDLIPNFLSQDVIFELNSITKNRIKNGELYKSNIIIESRTYPMMFFSTLPASINKFDVRKFERVYVPPDFKRLSKGNNYVWSAYSPDEILSNVKKFYKNLPIVYDSIVDKFFPMLKEQMKYFSDFNKLIIVVSLKEKTKDIPILKYYKLLNEDFNEEEIVVYMKDKDNIPISQSADIGSNIIIGGQRYVLVGAGSSVLSFMFEDLPMYNYIYELLDEKLEQIDISNL